MPTEVEIGNKLKKKKPNTVRGEALWWQVFDKIYLEMENVTNSNLYILDPLKTKENQ